MALNPIPAQGNSLWCSSGESFKPLLFLCYSNDMVRAVKNNPLLYADDCVIIASDKNPETVAHSLSYDMKAVNSWLIETNFHYMLVRLSSFYLVQEIS